MGLIHIISVLSLCYLSFLFIQFSSPHVLCSAKLVNNAGHKDEKVLEEECNSRIRGAGGEGIVGLVNIFSKQNVTAP